MFLKVCASDPKALISGYLQRYIGGKRSWKRYWFVIKNMVIYTFKASEDVCALESLALPGYIVSSSKEPVKGYPADLIIKLSHPCQPTTYFYTETHKNHKAYVFTC